LLACSTFFLYAVGRHAGKSNTCIPRLLVVADALPLSLFLKRLFFSGCNARCAESVVDAVQVPSCVVVTALLVLTGGVVV